MNNMDNEMKYKELVGKIKKAYLYAQADSTKAVLEGILPELKWDAEKKELRRNVEPTFKIGDWITFYGGEPFKILKVESEQNGILDYLLLSQNGHVSYYNKKYVDENARLWTIKDAKDGDIIAEDPIDGHPSPFVAIYKKQNEEDFDSHCFIGFDGNFYEGEEGHAVEDIHPATKEQRDLLFQKMREAGCEWNEKEKELRKIENTKEAVDLGKEIHSWMEEHSWGGYCSANIRDTAKHFFELGRKAR